VVTADPATLEHVFLNLISNALKFRRENVEPVVNISAEKRHEFVRIWVEDNGIGIDPRFSERVFRMFERVHEAQNYPGTGVGLAIVSTAMERLGGRCGVEPNPHGGSRFWLDFPVKNEPHSENQ
jgi:signal transduction histidine kinase